MKTRNSRNSKSMNNVSEAQPIDDDKEEDLEYNLRGLPKRRTTLNNNYSKLFV